MDKKLAELMESITEEDLNDTLKNIEELHPLEALTRYTEVKVSLERKKKENERLRDAIKSLVAVEPKVHDESLGPFEERCIYCGACIGHEDSCPWIRAKRIIE